MDKQALFALCAFDEATASLSALYCGQTDPQALSSWLSGRDFDALPSDLSCMAANAAAPFFSQMPASPVPRLRGLLKYVHTLNAGMTAGLLSLAGQWHSENISILLLEDTALALSCAEGGRRQLWQLRIGVSKADYARAVEIAHQNGWEGEASPWAATLKQSTTRQLTLFPFDSHSYLWQNTTVLQKGSIPLLLPEPAALLMGLCQLGFRALTRQAPRAAMVHWVMDMKLLLSLMDESQWQRALQLARQENACCHVGLLLHIYAAISGGTVDANAFCSFKEARKAAKLLEAFRTCPEKGHKAKRLLLLYRLRRPDSLPAALGLLGREIIKKKLG